MRIVSPLLKRVIYPGLSRTGLLRRHQQPQPVVVTYHGILPSEYKPVDPCLDGHLISVEAFRSQLALLKSRYNVISPEEFRRWCTKELELPPGSVLLTCDDGLLNTRTDMLPVIRELDVPFLFFVTGASAANDSSMLWYEQLELWRARIGDRATVRVPWRQAPYVAGGDAQIRALWLELRRRLSAFPAKDRQNILEDVRIQIGISDDWQSEYSQNEPLRRRFFMLNRPQLLEVARLGVTIGAHTLSHPMLSQMPEELAFEEMAASRDQLEECLGTNVWALAYPFGNAAAVSSRESTWSARAGFTCAFMNVEDTAGMFSFPRVHVSSGMTLPELEAHLSGVHGIIRGRLFQMAGSRA